MEEIPARVLATERRNPWVSNTFRVGYSAVAVPAVF